jgi:hypothetical protein
MPNPRQDDDRKQLDQDVRDVFVLGVKKASDFPEPYRQLLIDAYRFSAVRFNSSEEVHVPRTPDTLDIV